MRNCGPVAPVPVNVTVCCDEKASLSVITSVPVEGPAEGGVKITEIVQVAFGASGLLVQVLAETAKSPEAATFEMVRLLKPAF